MSILDQLDSWKAVDPQAMRHLLHSFPAQIEGAAQMARGISLPSPGRIENIVVSGLGGSAIGGDVVRSVVGRFLPIPLQVNRDYRLPGFVGSSTLVFACSYSGNTEETLAAYQEARKAKAFVIALTSGGDLAARARSDRFPLILLPAGLPPRAALGYSSVMLFGALHALGLIPDMNEALEETVRVLNTQLERYGVEVPENKNRAKAIARSLHGKIAAVYASSENLEAAAVRWRGQIEENAKNLALHHLLPEMNHNELVGWENPPEGLRQIGVVFLRDAGDHPHVARRFELTGAILRNKAGSFHEVWTEGDTLLARILSVIFLGDFVSLYLAHLNDVDPTPVTVIETLKQQLREKRF